jgi:hypothetical protein
VRTESDTVKQATAYRLFYINNTPVSNIVNNPLNGQYVSGTMSINGSAEGSYISNIILEIWTNSRKN